MRATTQAKKDTLISSFAEVRRKILNAASSLPSAARDKVFLGVWSIKDVLAHLVGWDYANIEAVKAIRAGKIPNFYSYHDRDWQTYNARLVKKYKRGDFADLLSSAKNSHRKLVAFLNSVSADEYDKDRGLRVKGYKVTIARILQAEINDETTHHAQIEKFRETRARAQRRRAV